MLMTSGSGKTIGNSLLDAWLAIQTALTQAPQESSCAIHMVSHAKREHLHVVYLQPVFSNTSEGNA
jgi:hypothetical protein